MKGESLILDQLRAAIACVFAGMHGDALGHVRIAQRELEIAHTNAGLAELARAKPTRVIDWDFDTSDVELGGES
jgi:hypothetical protein